MISVILTWRRLMASSTAASASRSPVLDTALRAKLKTSSARDLRSAGVSLMLWRWISSQALITSSTRSTRRRRRVRSTISR